ncbi:MAG: sigma-70 family RNA polymerase sigma factor [Gemmataceae bacterium]
MATKTGRSVIRHIRRAVVLCEGGTDAELLQLFAQNRDEAAFEALVRRHGPMVLGVCRRVVGHDADADDAFQATFLVLARKAGSIGRGDLLGNWLYGVALRTALDARSRMLRRRSIELPFEDFPQAESEADAERGELLALLDRELGRLAEKYRLPVVLCELEGRSRRDVAELLGIPEGTLSSRLAAARRLLAARLTKRGMAVSAAAVGLALSYGEASAAVPGPLLSSTVATAADATAAASANVAALSQGVLKTMFLSKLKVFAAMFLAAGLCTGGVTWVTFKGLPVGTLPAARAEENPPRGGSAKLEGAWKIESMSEGGRERPGGNAGPSHIFFNKDGKGAITERDAVAVAFTWKADASKKPSEIDLEMTSAPGADPRKLSGIYSLKGDSLTLCFGEPGKDTRPTTFEAGERVAVIKLKPDPDAKMPDLKNPKVAQSAARMRSQNNMKQIGLAMHNYLNTYQTFPAAAIYSKDGKPLLSWRVAILPFIEQDQLYKEFHLDEPWDSEHNKKLLAQMPKTYGDKGDKTHYRVFHGKGAAFEGTKGTKIQDFTDGTSNTVLAVEAVDAVEWTKPEELEYSADKPLPKLSGKPFEKGFNALYADGSVHFMSETAKEKLIRAVITRNGGEVIENDK